MHLAELAFISPVESQHALDLSVLKAAEITFWGIGDGEYLAGIGAFKALDKTHGEIKSMRTDSKYLRRGVAAQMLQHIIEHAKSSGYIRLSLETGPMEYFKPAQQLYASFGFKKCEPFAQYQYDPYSLFMTKVL